MIAATPDPASCRDPSGRVFRGEGRVFRSVMPSALEDFEFTRGTGALQRLAASGRIISEDRVAAAILGNACSGAALLLEHPALPRVSYPYEWSFLQLQVAAIHHLDLQLELLDSGITLSDASAYNVQFIGTQPAFIDALSFRRYLPGEPWQGYRQFCEQFLNPLLLRALIGVPHNAWYRGSPDGISVREFASLIRLRHCRHWQVLAHVVLHARFQRRGPGSAAPAAATAATRLSLKAFTQILHSLRGFIAGLTPAGPPSSAWEDYPERTPYAPEETAAKRDAVARFCRDLQPDTLCDLGCNTGDYTLLALQSGARTAVAIDAEDACIDRVFRRAAAQGLQVLPLCCDVANPSPAQGWAQSERAGLLERIGSDALLALGLVHHLAIGRNLPLPRIVDLLLSIAPRGLVEFVPKSDPMCARLLAHREDIFHDYHEDAFRALLESRATVEDSHQITASGRRLFRYRVPQA